MKILIADDDPQMVRALRITLTATGHQVIAVPDGKHAIAAAIEEHPDLYLLDLGMPELDGLDVIHAVRGWSSAPILVISGRTGSADKVEALDAGADDYVTKPFSVDELLARMRAVTRRGGQEDPEPVVRLGDITVDLASRSVVDHAGGQRRQVRLTPTEWQVLDLLVRNAGKLVTRQTMLAQIWGTDHVEDTGYLRLYLSQLRKKLEAEPSAPRHLLTEPGMGYRLVLDEAGQPGPEPGST
ncbi:response regulator [Propioniciclava coleopterorum]|uniref:Response regulator n=1 Tax=Propioniciclava coleopterorum TaxID=2714937 RepID=A0A6G7Y9D0_9ACTN|nr:response regulator [Propioniciclava coleopterorum]QIK73241.1 response regulator [Propioniciclava coleopterorum]